MVIAVDSSFHNVGTSTLSYMLSSSYCADNTKTVLLITVGTLDVVRYYNKLNKYVFDALKNTKNGLQNNIVSSNKFTPSLFFQSLDDNIRVDPLFYYYHTDEDIHSSLDNRSDFLELLNIVKEQFDYVIVDLNNNVQGYKSIATHLDSLVYALPPNTIKIREANKHIAEYRREYLQTHFAPLKATVVPVIVGMDRAIIQLNKVLTPQQNKIGVLRLINYEPLITTAINNKKLDDTCQKILSNTTKNKSANFIIIKKQLEHIIKGVV